MAAAWETIESVLLPDEINLLSHAAKDKIDGQFKLLQNKLEESRIQYERLRVTSEQQTFELEKQIAECDSRLETETNRVTEFQTKFNEYEQQCAQLTVELTQLQESHNNSLNEQVNTSRLTEQLELDKREAIELLEKRAREIESHEVEIKELREKLEISIKDRCEAITKSEEITSREVTLEYREKRLEQERELLSKQIDWLNKELSEKTQEVNSLRREKTTQTVQLQNQLEQVTEELSTNRDVTTTIKESLDKQAQENEALAQKLKDARDASVAMEEGYQQQLRAQTRLTELYKSSSEDNQKKIDELVTAVEELQNVLTQTQEEFQKQETEMLEKEEILEKELKALQEKVESMEKELESANKVLSVLRPKGMSPENIAALSPSAAIASNLLKSGMTLTQIYEEYTKMTEALRIEKHENEKLNQYIEQILQEIEDTSPQLQRQKEDYEKVLGINANLSNQLETALREFEKMRCETDEAKRKSGHLERDNERFVRQVGDLSLQVRTLLKEIEELRGGTVGNQEEEENDVSSTSAEIITKKLVTFKNIEELQSQNEQLLVVIRDLSEREEANEKDNTNERNVELEKALSAAMEELEELRTTRTKQAEMLESIVRQREMYRILLEQNQSSPPVPARGSPRSDVLEALSPNVKMKEALTQLQEDFKSYKQEKADNDKVLIEQAEKARDDASELRLQATRLTAQLEHANERYKILQSNFEGCKKENTALNDKNQRLAAQVLRHEQIAEVLRQDLMSVQEKCSRAEVVNENLKAERDLLKSMEMRLLQEKEVLLREQKGQAMLMANLQAIQNNLERGESEVKLRLSSRIELLEKENKNLRKKLEGEVEHYKTAVKGWEKEVNQVRERLEAEIEKHHKVRDELVQAYADVTALKQQVSNAETKLNTAEIRLSQSTDGAENSDVQIIPSNKEAQLKDLNFDLLNVKSENKALKDQLNQSKQHLEQYKTIANSVEQELKREIEASRVCKESMEKRLQENLDLHSELEQKLQELEKEKQDLINENQMLLNENLSQSSDLRKELARVQLELQNAIQKAELATESEEQARTDCQQQLRLAQEAKDKYEHELIAHAADVEALTMVKLQLEETMSKLPAAEEVARKASHALEMQNMSWEEQKHLINSGRKELEERCQQLEEQNAHLHDQIELMSTQMLALQTRSPAESLNISLSDDASKSAEQLMEIIRFLRRDKEIANTKLDSITAENSRFKSKNELLEKQLDELQKNAMDNMQNSQVTMATATQHAELLRKIEMVNVLTDSNKLLREERDSSVQNNKQLEAKLSSLEKELVPLQEKSRDLLVQRDTLASEVQVLKNEVKRWQARTTQLVEQCHRTSPEELKRANIEKENLQKQLTQLTEDTQRQRSEISRMNVTMSSLQNEVGSLTSNMQKKEKELEKASEDLRNKDLEMLELNKTITQVKKIGRKYKTQCTELETQYNELKTQSDASASKEQTDVEALKQDYENKLQEAESKNKTLSEQCQKLNDDLITTKKSEETAKAECAFKDEKAKKVLTSVRQRIADLTRQRNALTKEMEELKKQRTNAEQNADEGNLRLNTLRSQYEGRLTRMERELKEAVEERERIQKEWEELLSKKQFGQYQGAKVPSTASTSILTSGTSAEPPPTANIKPLASATNTAQRAHVVSTSAPPSRTTPTASIRPMAIPLTRKAMVPPSAAATSVSDAHEESLSATQSPPLVPQAAVAPTPATLTTTVTVTPTTSTEQISIAVAPVMVADENVSESETGGLGMPSSSTSPTPSTSDVTLDGITSGPIITASMSISTSNFANATTIPIIVVPNVEEQSEGDLSIDASTSRAVTPPSEVMPSSSSATKRQRAESGESPEKDGTKEWSPQAKKGRLASPEVRKQSDEEQLEIASSSGATVEASYEAVTSTSTEIATEKSPEEETVVEQIIDEIILVESDDDEDEGFLQIDANEDLEREQEDDEEEEEDEEEEDEDEMEGEFSQEAQLESDEQMQDDKIDEEHLDDDDDDMEEAQSDEDIVEIIVEDDDDDEQMEAQDDVPPSQQPMNAETVDTNRPSTLRSVPGRMERLPSTGRQLHSSFVPIGPGGHFDEGDDSIVPSTPILFLPRRSDGFAEAINSPHVPSGRFVFGASQEMVVPVSTQLASQGGMDDTRMDLQLDESSGRSVPTTPLQVSPPAENEAPQAVSPSPVVPEAPSDVTSNKGNTLQIQEISADAAGPSSEQTNEPIVEEPEAQQAAEETRLLAEDVTSNPPTLQSDSSSEPLISEIIQDVQRTPTSQPNVHQPPSTQRRPTPIVWNDPATHTRPQPTQPGRLPPGRRMRVPGARGGNLRGVGFRGRQMGGRPMMRRPMRRGGRQPF